MARYYPIMLDLRDRRVIVIGGDHIAAEKATALAASGAQVTVIAPAFCDELHALHQNDSSQVTLRSKAYAPGDLEGALVVIAATRDSQLIAAIETETRQRNQLLNVVDVPEHCVFIVPSVLRRGPLTIAVSTAGASPSLAKRIRQRLERLFPPAYAPYLRLAAAARQLLRAGGVSYDRRDEFFAAYDGSEVLTRLNTNDTMGAAALTAALLRDYAISVEITTVEVLERAIDADESE